MNSGYKPIPTLFWHRFLLLGIFISGAYLGMKFLPRYLHFLYFMDPSLVFSMVLIAGVIAWYIFFRIAENSFFTAMIPLMFLFWLILDKLMSKFAVSPKPHYFALGFIIVGGVIILYKKFKYLWNFQIFRFFLIFLIINVFYYFFHSSDFNVSTEGFMYGWQGGSGGKNANFIIFLDSVTSLLALCVPAALFSKINSMEEFKFYLHKMGNIFFIGFLVYFLLLPVTITCLPTGSHIFLPLNFFYLISLKLFIDNNYNKSKLYNSFFSLILLSIVFLSIQNSNKTAFAGFLCALVFFIFITIFMLKLKFETIQIPRQKYLTPILLVAFSISAYFLAEYFGIFDIVFNKISQTINSLSGQSGISSLYIRQSNWNYFILHWLHNLNLSGLLFGSGLGASREAIFYISATQYSKIYLVQTTHNQFTEMFYDYGLTCLFFYMPMIIIFFKDLITVFSSNVDKLIRMFSTTNLSMIIFFFIYHLTDGLRMETTIVFFSFIGFNEMAKHTLRKIRANDIAISKSNC